MVFRTINSYLFYRARCADILPQLVITRRKMLSKNDQHSSKISTDSIANEFSLTILPAFEQD